MLGRARALADGGRWQNKLTPVLGASDRSGIGGGAEAGTHGRVRYPFPTATGASITVRNARRSLSAL